MSKRVSLARRSDSPRRLYRRDASSLVPSVPGPGDGSRSPRFRVLSGAVVASGCRLSGVGGCWLVLAVVWLVARLALCALCGAWAGWLVARRGFGGGRLLAVLFGFGCSRWLAGFGGGRLAVGLVVCVSAWWRCWRLGVVGGFGGVVVASLLFVLLAW